MLIFLFYVSFFFGCTTGLATCLTFYCITFVFFFYFSVAHWPFVTWTLDSYKKWQTIALHPNLHYLVFVVRLPNRQTHLCAYVAMCYLWCCVYCLLTVCVQYSFNNQLCVSNVNYVRHYDVLRQYYVDCMYTIFV